MACMSCSVNRARIAVIWGCLVCLFVGTAFSQENAPSRKENGTSQKENGTSRIKNGGSGKQNLASRERTVIPLDSLPPPPAEIAKWIRLGNVQFFTGGDAPASNSGSLSKLDAATTYRFSYKVPSQSQWQTRNVGGSSKVTVKVAYQDIRLVPTHEVWLRNPVKPSRFWSDKLVRHELDHVRISSDVRWEKRFAQSVRRNDEFSRDLSSSSRSVQLSDVNRWINEAAQKRFEEINELIEIRYRELDRWTNHGRKALPEHVTLESLINAPSRAADPLTTTDTSSDSSSSGRVSPPSSNDSRESRGR